MKPRRSGEDSLPLELARPRFRDRTSPTVVDDFPGALTGTLFEKINADSIAAARDAVHPNTKSAKLIQRPLCDLVFRQARDVLRAPAELRDHHRDIRFRAAK